MAKTRSICSAPQPSVRLLAHASYCYDSTYVRLFSIVCQRWIVKNSMAAQSLLTRLICAKKRKSPCEELLGIVSLSRGAFPLRHNPARA